MKVFSEKTKNAVIVCIAIFSVITAVMVVMWLAQYAFNNSLIKSCESHSVYYLAKEQSDFFYHIQSAQKETHRVFILWMIVSILFVLIDGILIAVYLVDKMQCKKLGIKDAKPTKASSKRKILILGIAIISALSLSLVSVSYAQEEQSDTIVNYMVTSFIRENIIEEKQVEYKLVKNAELIKPSQYAVPGKFFGQMLYYVDVVLIVLLIVDTVNRKRKNSPDEKTE